MKKSDSKKPITIPSAPEKTIFVKSINGKPMQIDFQKMQPQLHEYGKNMPKINNEITDAD